jgi:hypothetical protein
MPSDSNLTPFPDLDSWKIAVRNAQDALEVSMRGDLPSTLADHESLTLMRMLCQKLDETLFWGFDLIRPRAQVSSQSLTLEDLFS